MHVHFFSLLRRLLPGLRRTRTIDLEPIHQRILRGLGRFGTLSFESIQAEISAEHETLPGETLLALLKLEHDGLLTRSQPAGQSRTDASYAPTADGRHVARLLPPTSASTIAFHL